MLDDEEDLIELLEHLKIEHRDMDNIIDQLVDKVPVDLLQLQRLKKRKLALRDQISRIESMLLPDIIA